MRTRQVQSTALTVGYDSYSPQRSELESSRIKLCEGVEVTNLSMRNEGLDETGGHPNTPNQLEIHLLDRALMMAVATCGGISLHHRQSLVSVPSAQRPQCARRVSYQFSLFPSASSSMHTVGKAPQHLCGVLHLIHMKVTSVPKKDQPRGETH
jgi:hypothetical protein